MTDHRIFRTLAPGAAFLVGLMATFNSAVAQANLDETELDAEATITEDRFESNSGVLSSVLDSIRAQEEFVEREYAKCHDKSHDKKSGGGSISGGTIGAGGSIGGGGGYSKSHSKEDNCKP